MIRILKRLFLFLVQLCIVMSLAGCGRAETAPAAASQDSPRQQAQAADPQSFVGRTMEEYVAVFGEALESEYAPSCMGEGKDGIHTYADHVVYTYLENGVETIRIIEPLS